MQKPWIVEIHAPSSSRVRSGRPSFAELGRGPVGVRDHQDRGYVDAAVDRTREALDEHRGLAGSRAGGDEDEALGLDRRVLLGGGRTLGGRGHARPS